MDPTQELAAMKKSIKKAKRVYKKLKKQQHSLRIKICESEKEKARKDRSLFIKNLQVSKVPSLLKRRLPADDDEDSTALRDYTFSIGDVFIQITQHLGPMEYLMFSRTSKSVAVALKDSFDVWASLFVDRIRFDSGSSVTFQNRRQPALFALIGKFQRIKQRQEDTLRLFIVMSMILSILQEAFIEYRRYGHMYPSIDKYTMDSRIDYLTHAHIFVENRETKEVRSASEYNLLFSSHSSKEVSRITERNFLEKHGFSLIKEDSKANAFDYFRYDDFNALNLNRSTNGTKCRHGVFMLDPVNDEIKELTNDKQFRVHILDHWRGKIFSDHYECRSAILYADLFRPYYSSVNQVTFFIDTFFISK